MDVSNPRRILAVSSEGQVQHLSRVVKDLTGTHPEPASSTPAGPSLAGTTHDLALKTTYYSATVPIWLDLLPDEDPSEWSTAFLAPEAREVLQVLGAVAVVFPITAAAAAAAAAAAGGTQSPSEEDEASKRLIREVGRVVREGLGGWAWDGVGLAVGVGGPGVDAQAAADAWEEVCGEAGLEFVLVRGSEKDSGRNEFGEKMGIARLLEALESNDWDQVTPEDVEADLAALEGPSGGRKTGRPGEGSDEDDFDPESLEFGFDKADFEGLKKAIWGPDPEEDGTPSPGVSVAKTESEDKSQGGGDASKKESSTAEDDIDQAVEVEKLEGMMRKLQAVRDMSAGLPENQRRRMAAKAVGEVMREL